MCVKKLPHYRTARKKLAKVEGALALQGRGDDEKDVAPHHCIKFTLTVQCRNLVFPDDSSPRNAKIVPLRLLIYFLGASRHMAPHVFVNAYSGEQSELMSFVE